MTPSDDLLISSLLAKGDGLSRQAAHRLRDLAAGVPDARVFGPLVIFQSWRDPEISGGPLRLPVLYLRFLQALSDQPGYWVSKQDLIAALWKNRPKPSGIDATLAVHVSNLRSKLTARLGFDPIETKKGLGYRLSIEALRRPGTDHSATV